MRIYESLAKIMLSADGIGKDRRNQQQNYQFRGIDDVYNALHGIFAANGVVCVPRVISERTEDRTTKSGSALIYRVLMVEFDLIADDGSKVTLGPIVGEGMDSGDKASNKAMSVAQKYALLQTFLIPTEEQKDPENESHELKAIPSMAELHDRAKKAFDSASKFMEDSDKASQKALLQAALKQGSAAYIKAIEALENLG